MSCAVSHTILKKRYPILGGFEKLRKATVSFFMPVCLYVFQSARLDRSTRLPLDGFSLNFIFEYFSKIC